MPLLKDIRLVVLGIDGLGVDVLTKLLNLYPDLQNLKKVKESCYPILSELPELSSVNWTSFFTKEGPEKHGIFGFVHIDPSGYRCHVVNLNNVKTPTIFEILGEKGFVCRAINVPNTYPAKPINGMMISGFVAEKFDEAIYPKFLVPILKSINYTLEVDTTYALKDKEKFLKNLLISIESRKRAVDLLWKDLAWNFFAFVITEFDRLCHFFLKDLFNPSGKYLDLYKNILKKIDQIVGDIFDRFYTLPDPKRLIIMSDHGFDEMDVEVDLNVWLRKTGFLCCSNHPKDELDASIIDEDTYAFALDPARVYIHTKDNFSRGKVDAINYSSVITDVKQALLALTYKGKKVIKKIFTKDELYPGCYYENAPDLLCVPEKGIDLKAKFNRKEIFGFFGRCGTHTREDALFWDSYGAKIQRVREVGVEILNFFKGRIYA